MKKLFLFSLGLLFVWTLAFAGKPSPATRQSPVDPAGNYYQSLDAAGVDIATSAFSASFTTAARFGICYPLGVYFSSGAVTDYVDIYSSGGWTAGANGGVSTPTYRVFNTASSSVGVSQPGSSAGYVPLNGGIPVRLPTSFSTGALNSPGDGCGFRPNSNGYHSINLHLWVEK